MIFWHFFCQKLMPTSIGNAALNFSIPNWPASPVRQKTGIAAWINLLKSGNSTNPFAIVTLAHLHAKSTKNHPEKRYQIKWMLIRKLYNCGFNRQQVIDLFRFIDWVLHLPDKLAKQLQTEIVAFEEKQKMPYISSVERIGEKKVGSAICERPIVGRRPCG
ncbi:MAG: hypothetical protein H7833_03475 [Magnetococcus sp. DMHC-1]|nr:hypothetical protein [Magnetococcales bacterium]